MIRGIVREALQVSIGQFALQRAILFHGNADRVRDLCRPARGHLIALQLVVEVQLVRGCAKGLLPGLRIHPGHFEGLRIVPLRNQNAGIFTAGEHVLADRVSFHALRGRNALSVGLRRLHLVHHGRRGNGKAQAGPGQRIRRRAGSLNRTGGR